MLIVGISIFALNAQILLAEAPKSAIKAYTDYSSTEARDILWLARIIYSESKTTEEQILIAWVVRNRVETGFRGADSYKEVALSHGQFSGLGLGDPQYKLNISRNYNTTDDKAWMQALTVAQAVYFADDSLRPISIETRHFYSPISVLNNPKWAKDKEPSIELKNDDGEVRFAFYAGVK